jgi:phage terminase small subunit
MALTPKEQSFVAEYLVDLNATQAVLRAGYKVKNDQAAASHGYRLLKKPAIAEAIQAGRAKKAAGAELSAQRVLDALMKAAFSDIRKVVRWETVVIDPGEAAPDAGAPGAVVVELEPQPQGGALKRSQKVETSVVKLVDAQEIDDDTAAAISEVSQNAQGGIKVKMADKIKALELLGRHLGMFEKKDDKPPPDPLDGMSAADLVAVLARLKGGGDVPGG